MKSLKFLVVGRASQTLYTLDLFSVNIRHNVHTISSNMIWKYATNTLI